MRISIRRGKDLYCYIDNRWDCKKGLEVRARLWAITRRIINELWFLAAMTSITRRVREYNKE